MVNFKECDLLAETHDNLTALAYASSKSIFKCLVLGIESKHGKEALSNVMNKVSLKEKETIFHAAMRRGRNPKELMRDFLDYGESKELLTVRNSKGRTPLHLVQFDHLEACKLLAEEKEADLLEVDDEKCNILGMAAEKGRVDILKWLIETITERHGLEEVSRMLNSPNSKGETPLIIAASENKLEIVKVCTFFRPVLL